MLIEELKSKALKVVEDDMARYEEAVKAVDEWTKKECSCVYVPSRFCTRCANIHHSQSIIHGIENKYWHG
jgi:hypothetical protein